MPAHLAMEYQIELNKNTLIRVDCAEKVILWCGTSTKLIYKSLLN